MLCLVHPIWSIMVEISRFVKVVVLGWGVADVIINEIYVVEVVNKYVFVLGLVLCGLSYFILLLLMVILLVTILKYAT